MAAWREALQQARQELIGEPYDPALDCTTAEASALLGMARTATERHLTALGWRSRTTKLPNDKWGKVWRLSEC